MGAKFAKAAYLMGENKTKKSVIARASKHGVPRCVVQKPCERASDVTTTRGRLVAAVLNGDPRLL